MAWTANKNDAFWQRIRNLAREMQQLRNETQVLQEVFTNDAQGDLAFVIPDSVSVVEGSAMLDLLNDYGDWLENRAVTQQDRVAVIIPFLTD